MAHLLSGPRACWGQLAAGDERDEYEGTVSSTEIPQPPPAPQPGLSTQAPTNGANGLATAGFVLGLLGLLGSWIPVISIVGILLGVIGVVLAGVGLARSKEVGVGKGLAIAGLILGALAVVIAIIVNVVFLAAVDEAVDDATGSSNTASSSDSSSDSSAEDGEAESSFVDGVLTTPDVKIVITDHKVIQAGQGDNEYGDKPVLAFWYEVTNLTNQNVDALEWDWLVRAYQDNDPNVENELDTAFMFPADDSSLADPLETIKKGGTVKYATAYELDDQVTPVELVAEELFGDEIGRMTYNLK